MSLWDALNDWPNREDDGADLKAVLDQNLAWLDLASAENPKKAAELGKRLRAEPQDAYQSARLELLSAAAFRSAGWVLDWEPTLLGTNKTVEFRATRDSDTCLVEARLSGPERVIGDHRDVTDPLAELISDLRLPCLLMIEWAENPPALAALDDLWPDIKEELGSVCEGETRREIRVRHMGQTYRLVIERFGEGEGVMPSTGILNVTRPPSFALMFCGKPLATAH